MKRKAGALALLRLILSKGEVGRVLWPMPDYTLCDVIIPGCYEPRAGAMKCPTETPSPVPIEYPRAPQISAGLSMPVQPLALAIAAAVPGPPTAAFDAVRIA